MYSIKTWTNETSQPETRMGLPYALAYALAVNAGFAKAQVINEFGIIELETKFEEWKNKNAAAIATFAKAFNDHVEEEEDDMSWDCRCDDQQYMLNGEALCSGCYQEALFYMNQGA